MTEAWCGFERAYRWADRAAVRQEVLEALRKPPIPTIRACRPSTLGYALARPAALSDRPVADPLAPCGVLC